MIRRYQRLLSLALLSLSLSFSAGATLLCREALQPSIRWTSVENRLDTSAEALKFKAQQELIDDVLATTSELVPFEKKLQPEQKKMIRKILLYALISQIKGIKELLGFSKPSPFLDLSEKNSSVLEFELHRFMASLVKYRQMKYYLNGLLDLALKIPILKNKIKPQENFLRGYAIEGGVDGIEAIVQMRGLLPIARTDKYERWTDWKQQSENAERVLNKQEAQRSQAYKNSVSDPRFIEEILTLGKTKFAGAEEVRILKDGSESFPVRNQLIKDAKESIDIMVWAVVDDYTGNKFADLLQTKINEGVKVRIIVDGKVNRYFHYSETVKRLEAMGAEVVRWVHPETAYLGMHRKILLVDNKVYIAGGLNVGDAYSHENPDLNVHRWRDTDILVRGSSAVREARKLFAEFWNQQVEAYPHLYGKYDRIEVPESSRTEVRAGETKIALIEGQPGPKEESGTAILHVLLKALRGAEKTVDIENAYVILGPALRTEIKAAISRGVKIRVFTNSDRSVDEAIISKAMLRNAMELYQMGCEVYLRKNTTLHSKVMLVDGIFSLVKSYNWHPRSERTDLEVAFMIYDFQFGQKVRKMFEDDIRPEFATKIQSLEDIPLHNSWLDRLLLDLSLRIGYDVL